MTTLASKKVTTVKCEFYVTDHGKNGPVKRLVDGHLVCLDDKPLIGIHKEYSQNNRKRVISVNVTHLASGMSFFQFNQRNSFHPTKPATTPTIGILNKMAKTLASNLVVLPYIGEKDVTKQSEWRLTIATYIDMVRYNRDWENSYNNIKKYF